MQVWMKYAFVAAIFIALRDYISKDIFKKYSYVDYIIIANTIAFIGTLIYIIFTKKKISKIPMPNLSEFSKIIIRLLLIYFIIDLCIFNSLKRCNNPGYAYCIINICVFFLLTLMVFFHNRKIDFKKIFGGIIILLGTYFIS
tara:strand:+ start:89 stop:514 length:426 start_codon:yes stop_codon:yes gene_type:complete